jgi:peptidoglycan hydrolase-like protein with peptidoglycan-binding domain
VVTRALGHWTPAVIALAVVAAIVGAGFIAGRESDSAGASTTTVTVVETTTTVPQVVTVATSTAVQKVPLTRTLGRGMTGPEVRMVQQRLKDLGFDPGGVDGVYGDLTITAVWAYQKLVLGIPSDEVTGQVTPQTWDQMQDPIEIRPRRPNSTPNHTEIYLPEQVMIVFHADRPVLITHISSGDGKDWCEEVTISPGEFGNEKGTEPLKTGVCGTSKTPGGVYSFYRRVEGRRDGQLGSMWNPVYFNYGIAVHGAQNVPLHPASHGCIRIPMFISDYFPSLVAKGDQVFVFDGVKDPERYGEQPPIFNRPDPAYTTTTSSTTTTTSTTVAPTTTKPAPTTTRPATTTAPPPTSAPATTSSVAG